MKWDASLTLFKFKKTANLKLTELSERLTAMSYVSFFKNIPDFLGQPTGIAALASLGIHGAIAFILPLMPVDSSKSTKQAATSKPIGLLELNATEQGRLPQKVPVQTGIQAQLPPLPGQIAALPAQQQIPFNITNTPPAPSGSSTPMSALPPLPQNPGYNISSLPRSSSYKLNRKDLLIDPSFKSNSPSVAFSGNSRTARSRFNTNIAYEQPRVAPSSLPEVASTNVPSNLSANPAPLPLPTEAAPPLPDNGTVEPSPSASISPVTPDNFVTPTGQMPKAGEGNLAFAQNGMQPFKIQPGQSELLEGTNAVATAPAGVTAPSSVNPTLGSGSSTENQKNTISFLETSNQFRTQYPKGRFHSPILIRMDKSQVEQNVDVTVSMDREGKIDSFNILGDSSSLSSASKLAIRERVQQHFKGNSSSANGQGDFYSFSISPDGSVSSAPADGKVSSPSEMPTLPGLGNNQSTPVVPPSTTSTTKPLSRVELNKQPVLTPQQNSQRTTQPTPAASLPPFKPAATPVKPITETVSPVRTLTPKVTPLPVQPVIVPAAPAKPAQGSQTSTQSVPAPQLSQKPVVEKLLRDRENQQSSVSPSQSLIQKL